MMSPMARALRAAAVLLAGACWATPSGALAAGRRPAQRSPYPAGAQRPALGPGAFARAAQAAAPTPAGKKKHKPALHGDPARALVSFQAMQKTYYIPASALYAGEPFSYLWPFSQAFAATVSMAFIPHLGVNMSTELHARLAGLNSYLDINNSGAPEGLAGYHCTTGTVTWTATRG